MDRNLWVLGERFVSGKYRRVLSMGDLKIEDSNILKIYSIGDIDIKNSVVRKFRGLGDIKGANVSFGNVSIVGSMKLTGEVKADVLITCGNLTAEFLSCKVLRNFAKSRSKTMVGSEAATPLRESSQVFLKLKLLRILKIQSLTLSMSLQISSANPNYLYSVPLNVKSFLV